MTKKLTVIAAFGFVLAIGVRVAITAPADDNDAFTDIKKQADQVGKKSWDDLTKDGKALAKKHEDMLDIMYAFKLRKSKTPGIGVGPTPDAILPDGIEAKIAKISKDTMEPTALDKESKDLIRMAEITAAVASISNHQCPVDKKTKDRDPKEWAKWMKDMHDHSLALIKAVKEKKPADVKSTALKLNGSCIECHEVFRDKVP